MKKVTLGTQGLQVPQIGLGCMGMTGFAGNDMYGKAHEDQAIATIHRSFELGGNWLDTADLYGPFDNEKLIAKAVGNSRHQYIIATKFGWEIDDSGTLTWTINGRPDYVRKALERSLQNLKTDYIDLFYLHRLDKSTPVEETVGAMAELVHEGKVRYLGLSEVSAETVRKANAVHPITAVQSEYSLFERTVEARGILRELQEMGVGFVAYSPLGRGFLSGAVRTMDDLPENDFRRHMPRFQPAYFDKNIELLQAIEALANQKNITPSQLALAWVLKKGALPIPGTKRRTYLEQNMEAAFVELTDSEMEKLEAIVPLGIDTGNAYDEFGMGLID
ncbi:aryl-alcohol dehydrogenase-like predicted oxidoreductase [Larkinella arboricola]|uniref:Aryl-alcohol dehydrogenase-like predicted oxidoreductase n=1 Tax=Larkinella arboricola TaxID=643671 RepID=A0A327WNT2_LARAB|nr:aldo/keto reductase [Larkinella arboricola]RAJ93255.1 aryl-alcohol dehydrogenase-like predicted oxidoreductase [Larkinella arboricola]